MSVNCIICTTSTPEESLSDLDKQFQPIWDWQEISIVRLLPPLYLLLVGVLEICWVIGINPFILVVRVLVNKQMSRTHLFHFFKSLGERRLCLWWHINHPDLFTWVVVGAVVLKPLLLC